MLDIFEIQTPKGDALVDVTDHIKTIVAQRSITEGLCVVIVPHTTAGITINSGLDPATPEDIIADMMRLVPKRVDFIHQYDTPADAAGHIKAAIIGHSITLAISDGKLLMGGSQSILFYEFDGPRKRKVQVKIIAG